MRNEPINEEIPIVDWDECFVIASDDCAVYFDVFQDESKKWFMFADLDADTFTECLAGGDGPYDTEKSAVAAGVSCAVDWFVNNEIFDFEYSTDIPKEFRP